jgi:deoxyribonuclease-4
MPLGAHLPTSKGFEAALAYAQELQCECLQIFAKSPRQWKANPIDPEKAASFRKAWKASGLKPLVAHDSYLINLAAPDETVREKSVAAMIDEIERCDLLGCDYLVTHCGAHGDKTSAESEAAGVRRLAESLEECFKATPESKVVICLENTAGQGSALGGPFEHIGEVFKHLKSKRLGVCFDTCHAWAAGHDIVHDLKGVLTGFDEIIGLEHLKVIHLNDSKGAFGKHLDRHEHIGEGQIGREAMGEIVGHPKLKHLPFILETPETETHILMNLATVRKLREG